MNEDWTDRVQEWIQNKVYLLSTPVGAGVGVASFILGMIIGRLILSMT